MSWTFPKTRGKLPYGRGGHAGAAVGTKCYFFGGANRSPEAFNDLWILETDKGKFTWSKGKEVPKELKMAPRSGMSMTSIGGKLYIFGGQDPETGICFNDVVVFDPSASTWERLEVSGGSPPPRHGHSACCFQENRLLVFGGATHDGLANDVYILNIETCEWTKTPVKGQAPAGRELACAVAVPGVGLVLHGGKAEGVIFSDTYVLDLDTLAWSKKAQSNQNLCAHVGLAVDGGKVHMYGGFSGTDVSNKVLELELDGLKLKVLDSGEGPGKRPHARFAHSSAVVTTDDEAKLIVFGGVNPMSDLDDVVAWAVPVPKRDVTIAGLD